MSSLHAYERARAQGPSRRVDMWAGAHLLSTSTFAQNEAASEWYYLVVMNAWRVSFSTPIIPTNHEEAGAY
eukprot:3771130-Prymnesium_polylepis.1